MYNNKDLTKFHQFGAYHFVKLLINKLIIIIIVESTKYIIQWLYYIAYIIA